jgi:hypothetical protein
MGGFSLAISHFLHQEDHVFDFLGKMPEGKLWTACFLLALSCHGVVGVSVYLFWESRHVELMRVADQWARSPCQRGWHQLLVAANHS